MAIINNPTTIITGKRTRLSYAHIFEPQTFEGGASKYSVSLLIPKDDKETLNKIHAAIQAAYEKGESRLKGNGRTTPALSAIGSPLNDGDKKGDEVYAGCYYINAKNDEKPKVFDQNGNEVMDRSEVYSGCYAKVKISFFAYNHTGNKGIACSLQGLQKVADGEPLGGNVTTADDFADEDEDFLN